MANKQIQIKVTIKGKINSVKLISSNPMAFACFKFPSKNTKVKEIDNTLSMAEVMALRDTAIYFPIISSPFDIGKVKRVSKVPLSFSPAITSVAG